MRANHSVRLGKVIGRHDLQVGQWIKFSTKNGEGLSEDQKTIYQEDRFFLVVTREDAMMDSCRCTLADENGKIYDYCPRMNSLNYVNLVWQSGVTAFSTNEIENIYEKERILLIYEAAKKYLEDAKDYYSKYPAEKLNVIIEIQNITHKIVEKAYTEGAIIGAFSGQLPREVSSHIGTFIGRKEGGRLAQTCKLAQQNANERKNEKMGAIEAARQNLELKKREEDENIRRAQEESARKYQEEQTHKRIEAEKRFREEQERLAAEEQARIAAAEAQQQLIANKIHHSLAVIKTNIEDKLISPELNHPLNDLSKP